jgi:hypothetical protein
LNKRSIISLAGRDVRCFVWEKVEPKERKDEAIEVLNYVHPLQAGDLTSPHTHLEFTLESNVHNPIRRYLIVPETSGTNIPLITKNGAIFKEKNPENPRCRKVTKRSSSNQNGLRHTNVRLFKLIFLLGYLMIFASHPFSQK